MYRRCTYCLHMCMILAVICAWIQMAWPRVWGIVFIITGRVICNTHLCHLDNTLCDVCRSHSFWNGCLSYPFLYWHFCQSNRPSMQYWLWIIWFVIFYLFLHRLILFVHFFFVHQPLQCSHHCNGLCYVICLPLSSLVSLFDFIFVFVFILR